MARRRVISPSVVHAMQIRRLALFAICLLGGFGFLAYRLVDLQVAQHERFAEAARNNTERTFERKPKRGDIRDARGNLLATSKLVHNIRADPAMIGTNYLAVAVQLAPHLQMRVDELAEKLKPRLMTRENNETVPVRWVNLKKKVEAEEWERIRATMEKINFGVDESKLNLTQRAAYQRIRRNAVFSEPDELRYYPSGTLAAHVLGYVGLHEHTNAHGLVIETRGKDGLEYSLNSLLTGVSGWRRTETDSRRRELVPFREQDVAPRPGLNAILTIDGGVQHIVEGELAEAAAKHSPVSISCIVTRPKTGEILALASLPTFDPNDPGGATPDARRNRVITDVAEPGSTFKVVVIAAALNERTVSLNDTFDCENGRFIFAGKPLHDDHPFEVLTVERIISKSSNIGAAKIGIQLGKQRIHDYVRAFGFGAPTGISLPGEVGGIFAKVPRWNGLSISRIPMGHEIACTPLQMVMAVAAIANGGVLMRPMLVDRLIDETGAEVVKYHPEAIRRVVSNEAAAKMVEALKTAVSTNGTAIKARLAYYTAAGKTGTAQKLVNGRYVRNKHYSSFIGFFPADDPQLCISVVIDDPKKGYYAGETAAPVFQRIAERAANYLAIPPELIPSSNLAASSLMPAPPTHGGRGN
jgi:cell division protein FtsI/penicillin-binding protein 2